MERAEELAALLTCRDNNTACGAAAELCDISRRSDAGYKYFDLYIELLDAKSSLVRNRALALIAANARWDGAGRLDGAVDKYLSHVTDEKPITARQCLKALPEIAEAKPALAGRIRRALEAADFSPYADSMRPLLIRDAMDALMKIGRLQENA